MARPKITCAFASIQCEYAFVKMTGFGCNFKGICQYQRPLMDIEFYDEIRSAEPSFDILKYKIICGKCGEPCKPIAHDTGDGWAFTLDCECQSINDVAYFDWPAAGKETLTPKEVEEMGFEIV